MRGPAFFAYANNYLIDVKFGVIMDVEASRAIRQAEVGAAKTMIERTEQRFDIKPEWLAADTAYGSGANLNWLVNDKKIAPHIPVIDKSKRVMLLARWPRLKHSSDRAMTENALRCCLHISNVSCGSAACDCAGRTGPNSSSHWQRSLRTSAGWPSSSHGRLRCPRQVWRKNQVTLKSR